jgi:predicted nucleic acid-binding protein
VLTALPRNHCLAADVIRVSLLHGVGTGGNLTTDVQLAAFAFEYDADMFSNDTDFARFPGLRWRNPLA